MKLFILAIIILIALCLLFLNHFNNKFYIRIDNSIEENIISDIENIDDEIIIADNSIIKENKMNLDDIKINIKKNGIYKKDKIVSKNDLINIEIENINVNYKIYYSLKNENIITNYEIFTNDFLNKIDTPNKFNLYIKIVTNSNSKEFDLGEFKLYDIIYKHNSKNIEEVELGTIYNEDSSIYVNEDNSEYKYDDKEINQNIVIDNVQFEEQTNNPKEEIILEENEITDEMKQAVNLKGNIYVVEETDLTEIEITGHLIIDTEENIIIEENVLDIETIHSITVKSNNFTINNEKYSYEYNENELKINNSNNEIVNIQDIFSNSSAEINELNELTIIKDEQNSSFNYLMENSKSNLLQL